VATYFLDLFNVIIVGKSSFRDGLTSILTYIKYFLHIIEWPVHIFLHSYLKTINSKLYTLNTTSN